MDKKPLKRSKLTVQVLPKEMSKLELTALEIRERIRAGLYPAPGRGRPVGPGTVAARVLEKVISKYPKILEEILRFHADEQGLVAAEDAEEYKPTRERIANLSPPALSLERPEPPRSTGQKSNRSQRQVGKSSTI